MQLQQTPSQQTLPIPAMNSLASVKNAAEEKNIPQQPAYSEVISITTHPKRMPSKESSNRIALVGGDVILEEEEEEEEEQQQTQHPQTTTISTIPPAAEPIYKKSLMRPELPTKPVVPPVESNIYVNVQEIPKKNQYYGQNINDTPNNINNNDKINTAKLKIEKDYL